VEPARAITYHHPMRGIATIVVLVASCRFDPTGGVPAADDVVVDDAASVDAAIDGAVIVDAPIDARAIDAPPAGCPATYDVLHLGRRYRFDPIAAQHALAKADCEADLPGRTHLATFEIVADMTSAIDDVDPGNSATPWVGAACVAPDCNSKLSWLWLTAIPIDPAAWAEGQPDSGGSEKVARAERDGNGRWSLVNVPATSTLPYICECEPF
jgi:hypothetical protein